MIRSEDESFSGEEEEDSSESKSPTSRCSPPPLKSSIGKRPTMESGSKRPKKKKTVVAVPATDVDTGMDDDQSKKPRSKSPTSPSPSKSSGGKQPAPESESVDPKRQKKKKLFQRLWSEDDEVELIQGMINYLEDKGKDPVADLNNFHKFMKKSLHLDVNNIQMSKKVRRLKQKFQSNFDKVEKTGKAKSLSNPHEKKMYELSKKLWGNGSDNKVKTNQVGSGKVNGSSIEVEPNVVRLKPSSHWFNQHGPITDEHIVNKGLALLSGPKKVEAEEKWKTLKVHELKNFLTKVELMKEQTEIVLTALTESGAN